MENLTEKQMVITDENGVEHLCEILFTFENEERGTSYVVFFELDNPDEVLAMRYNEDGTLQDIEDDEEFEEVLEVFEAFDEEQEKTEQEN